MSDVLIDANEKMQEKVSNIATQEVNSSMMCISDLLEICNDVITKRQNPKRFAEVFRICCEVLFAILSLFFPNHLAALQYSRLSMRFANCNHL